jgi:D-3-phosphoglycerate dehydrogenase
MKIVITELNWPIGIELLEAKGWDVVYDPDLWKNENNLQDEIKFADAVIVRNQTKVDADLLGSGHNLKVVGRLGVGLDNIDLQAAEQHNIRVCIGKNANATSVAEYVIGAMFQTARLFHEASADVRSGGWNRRRFTGCELSGKTLGLIGVGEIGHRAAVRAKMLGMNIIGYDPFVSPHDFPISETGIQLDSFERVIERSDYVSLHVPLNTQTRNLINKQSLGRMKNSAVVINTARGGIINEDDLNTALENGWIAAAVIDVLEQEPPSPDHPLLKRENCIITPHIAGLTEQSQIRTAEMVSNEVIKELEARADLGRVNVRK